jgi:hypothetical protein
VLLNAVGCQSEYEKRHLSNKSAILDRFFLALPQRIEFDKKKDHPVRMVFKYELVKC